MYCDFWPRMTPCLKYAMNARRSCIATKGGQRVLQIYVAKQATQAKSARLSVLISKLASTCAGAHPSAEHQTHSCIK